MTTHIHLSRGAQGCGNLQKQDFDAAAFRLLDGEPWNEKVLKECQLTMPAGDVPRQWSHKANT